MKEAAKEKKDLERQAKKAELKCVELEAERGQAVLEAQMMSNKMPKKERRSTAQRQSVKLRMKDRPTPDSSRVSSVQSSLQNSPRSQSLTPTEMSRVSKADETLPKAHEEL